MVKNGDISVGFISLGCAKNVADAEVMAGVLLDNGVALAAAPEVADVIIVNTCAFIDEAREETAAAILQACAHKRGGGCKCVVVTGCFAQRYNERLPAAFPEVDAFAGVDEIDNIAAIVRRVVAGESGVVEVSGRPKRLFRSPRPTLSFSGGPFSWLKIAEGCNRACAFCAIPAIRGRFRSHDVSSLVAEAATLIQAGSREINLISQDTVAFGRDLGESGALEVLLRELDNLDGDFWIRVLYLYPSMISDSLLETIAGSRHICRYFDVPLQHSHEAVLRAMCRADTIEAVATLPQRIRATVPDAVLRTTFLVGFPGERAPHFAHLLHYLEEAQFDHVGVFAYSAEEGTAAFEMRGVPSERVARERQWRLVEAQKEVVRKIRQSLKGSDHKALLIKPLPPRQGETIWEARLERQAADVDGITRVAAVPAGKRSGDWLNVTITGGYGYNLRAVATDRDIMGRQRFTGGDT